MEPFASKVLTTAATAVVRRLLAAPAAGAGLVERPVRLSGWVAWRAGKKQLAERDVRKLVQQLVLRAGDADPAVRLIGPAAGARVVAALTGTLMALDTITLDVVEAADLSAARLAARLRSAGPDPDLDGDLADLYATLLEVCCLQVIEFFSSQPGFGLRTAVAQSRALGELRDRLPDRDADAQRFEQRLRAGLSRALDQAQLFGLRLPPGEQTYQLSTAYVSLMMYQPEPGGAGRAGWGRRAYGDLDHDGDRAGTGSRRVEEALAGGGRWLIEGAAGAGKTTLLRRLAVHACRGDLPDQLAAWRDAVPFLLPLRTVARAGPAALPAPEDFVAVQAAALVGEKPGRWVSDLMDAGRALVLVDGVDEVAEHQREGVLDWLEDLAVHYPNASYLVTSRPAAMQENWRARLRRAGFATATLQPMTRSQVEDFIDRWHEAAQTADTTDDVLSECAASLKNALVARRDLRQLATTPLLCAMLCALNRNNNDYLPQGRVALYNDALTMLLERRDSEQRISTGPIHLTRDQLEPMLSRLAIWMMLNGQRAIPRETARQSIEDPLRRVRAGGTEAPLTAETALQHLIERSGLLQQPTPDLIEFNHPSFQDYLAASEVFGQKHLGHLLRNAHDPLYHDVVIMAVGQTQRDPTRQQQLLRRLIDRAGSDGGHGRRLWLLAAACIASVGMVDPDLADRVHQETSTLLPPASLDEADSLAQAGEFVLDLLADVALNRHLTDAQVAATVRTAGLIGSDGALPLLAHFRLRESPVVQEELVTAWFRSTEPARYVEEILADAALDRTYVTLTDLTYLPRLPRLRRLRLLRMPAVTQTEDLRRLADLRYVPARLEALDLEGTGVADIAALARMTNLRRLDLRGTPVADLAPLAGLTGLTELDLRGTAAADIAALARLTHLRRLDLRRTAVADIGPLAGLTSLRELDLWGTAVTDIAPLAGLTTLWWLELWGTGVVDAGPLAGLTPLRWLDLGGTRVADVAALAGLTSLRWLDLRRTRVADARPLAAMANLQRLDLGGTGVTDVAPLAGLTSLRQLDLRGTAVADVTALAGLVELQELDLRGTAVADVTALAGLASLRQLDLRGTGVTDVAPLAGVTGLQRLLLGGAGVSDVTPLAGLTGLQVTYAPFD